MASGAVWGIDIGQCALKALRCRTHEDGVHVVAEAFDYIEYPKILSQPGSDPAELIGDALKQFLSRNSVVGDRVAVSVSGQAGLARFIKLPPVEAKKIPDMVRYEARQQIPFDLNDVIWDYQRIGVGSEEEGFALETEVGLFAMKRDAVLRALDPFIKSDIEVDIVQLTPLVLYNFLSFDLLGDLPPPDEYDPENPPESVVVISVGTDATDLVISNGYRVWQRPIPLGGSHFTKALTKELKLTFAKAEHLKRNATAAPDPKAVFQAMKPVFNDLLTELQRSISYFSNLDRAAKIGRVIALGNATKLPGLRRFLSQQLGFEIEKIDTFPTLTGSQVVAAPSFQENLLSFPVAYGLSLQGLSKGAVHTNLLPREIIYDRLVKRKKPWALTAVAILLLGCCISFAAYSLGMGSVDVSRWKTAETEAGQVVSQAGRFKSEADQAVTDFQNIDKIGHNLIGNVEGRVRWLELLKAIDACLPADPPKDAADADKKDGKNVSPAERISNSKELHITNLDCQQTDDVSVWYSQVKQWDPAAKKTASESSADPTSQGGTDASTASDSGANGVESGPKGPGWIIRLYGYHYHNADRKDYGAEYVRRTLIDSLSNGKLKLPSGDQGKIEVVTMKELGISHPMLIDPQKIQPVELPNPNADLPSAGPAGRGDGGLLGPGRTAMQPGAGSNTGESDMIHLQQFDFNVHFCWQPKSPTARLEAKKAAEAKTQAENSNNKEKSNPTGN
jgi:type IV pilus assembly protein PilM